MSRLLALLPFVFLCACKSTESGDIAWRSLVRSPFSGVAEAGAHVARNSTEWHELWSLHGRAVIRPSSAPEVDFEREMAILVSGGESPTAGWSLEVTGVTLERGALVVHARVVAPPADSLQAQVVTAPGEVIVTSRRDEPVRVRITR